jgi:hypothetical protein
LSNASHDCRVKNQTKATKIIIKKGAILATISTIFHECVASIDTQNDQKLSPTSDNIYQAEKLTALATIGIQFNGSKLVPPDKIAICDVLYNNGICLLVI